MVKYVVFDICANPKSSFVAPYDTTAEFYTDIEAALKDFQHRKDWRYKSDEFIFLPDKSSHGCAVYRCYDEIIEVHISEIKDIESQINK